MDNKSSTFFSRSIDQRGKPRGSKKVLDKALVLDIAMNLNRIGNWAADSFKNKQKRIRFFLDQTNGYIDSLNKTSFSDKFKKTFDNFLNDYKLLRQEGNLNSKNNEIWGEKMMTWGNILTHRSKLI